MDKGKTGQRILLQLDPRIALEAIILNQLERIPQVRRQEWLRGLLVQGFRAECQVLREQPKVSGPSRTHAFSSWLVRETPGSVAQTEKPREAPKAIDKPSDASKPFAALDKVIG
ncbi:MAG: hypothetical protein JAZ02_08265 [Candidatus Thiodiazotropha endolucinida]|nr:hypothetical protein [Candidatus Thiodiazotropha endolucinida]